MPYALIERPSLGLGLLQAILERKGFSTKTVYGSVLFCEKIGLDLYEFGATAQEDLVGDWTFAQAAFPDFKPDYTGYLERVLSDAKRRGFEFSPEELMETMLEWRRIATEFIDELARQVLALYPLMVGCSSTCSSPVACLALLKRVRELSPDIVTLMGGSSCESGMGLATHEMFPWVDYVVSGEADDLIVDLVRGIKEHGRSLSLDRVPEGVFAPVHREMGYLGLRERPPRAVCRSLDTLPMPQYDDYFTALRSSPVLGEVVKPGLVIEGSRGCWWGHRNQCLFCSLNGQSRRYRTKPVQKIIEELETLHDKHQGHRIEFADMILDPRWFRTLFPEIEKRGKSYRLSCETIPSLSKRQIEVLSKARVTYLQPGIESLDPQVLKLLNKGSKAWQNIRFLKWSLYYGIYVLWIILYRAPGEDKAWYSRTAKLLPLLHHLQPPMFLNPIRHARFSVYYSERDRFNLDLFPLEAYSAVYPLSEDQVGRLAKDFECIGDGKARTTEDFLQSHPDLADLLSAVGDWNRLFYSENRPVLEIQDTGTSLHIRDTRRVATAESFHLNSNERAIYLACEDGLRLDQLPGLLDGQAAPISTTRRIIADLMERKLLLLIDDHLLSLGLLKPLAELRETGRFRSGEIDRMLYAALTYADQDAFALVSDPSAAAVASWFS